MALKNIKFIDVVNGEIIRVEHVGVLFERAEDDYIAQEGDIVLAAESDTYITKGGFYEVEYVDWAGDPQIYDDAGDERDFYDFDYVVFKRVIPDKKTNLKEGMYVKITGVDATDREVGAHGFEIGEIARVVDLVEHFEDRIKAVHLDGREYWFVHVNDFEVLDADDEEVRDAIVYTNLGRKYKEIKEGDIVQVIADSFGHSVGTIGVAVSDSHFDIVRVRANGVTFLEKVRLIAPVESVVSKPVLD